MYPWGVHCTYTAVTTGDSKTHYNVYGDLERHLENLMSPPMVALILLRKIVKETDVICSVVYGLYSSSIFCHDSIYEINIFL